MLKVTPSMLQEHWGTVTGSEHELGVYNRSGANNFDETCLPAAEFIQNGGRIYDDVGHPEICTPEASNPLQLVALERAMERRAVKLGLSAELYKNCVDFAPGYQNNAFAAHENYFTRVSSDSVDALVPFLVSRIIFTGAGDTSLGDFTLSQRAPHITCLRGEHSLWNRPLLHERDEAMSSVPSWRRLHLICNDANMCATAILLKHGTTMLVLRLLEANLLEPLPYNEFQAIDDLQRLNEQTSDWDMKGTRPRPMKAVDVQGFYLNQVATKISNASPLEKFVISMWREVLARLATDPGETFGIVDWTTKKALIDQIRTSEEGKKYLPETIDLTYHNLDRKVGLYFGLEDNGTAERLLSPQVIGHFTSRAPRTTRAWARGEAIRLAEWARLNAWGEIEVHCTWQYINVYISGKLSHDMCLRMPDPRQSYGRSISEFKRRLGA